MASSAPAASWLNFIRRKFQQVTKASSAPRVSTTLRLLVLPVGFRRASAIQSSVKSCARLQCHFILYPLPNTSIRPSVLRNLMSDTIDAWKTGLWVLSRGYRYLWDATFKPTVYNKSPDKDDHNVHSNALERTRKKIYDWSDGMVSRWMHSSEEELLRTMNTHAQFIHFNQNLHIPFKKIEILLPESLENEAVDLISPYRITSSSPIPSPPSKQVKLSSETKTKIWSDMQDIGQLSQSHFKLLANRSKLFFILTVPFYLIWPLALSELDSMLSIYHPIMMQDGSSDWFFFQKFESLVSLPLAYNLVRWFAYQRCVKAGKFLNSIMDTETSYKPVLEEELKRLNGLMAKDNQSISEASRQTMATHIEQLEKTLAGIGMDIVTLKEKNEMSTLNDASPVDLILNGLKEGETRWIDKTGVRALAAQFNIPAAQLYKDIVRTTDKLKLLDRLKDNGQESTSK